MFSASNMPALLPEGATPRSPTVLPGKHCNPLLAKVVSAVANRVVPGEARVVNGEDFSVTTVWSCGGYRGEREYSRRVRFRRPPVSRRVLLGGRGVGVPDRGRVG